ncbi:hypothetical protein [Obesumbacterium proteus]|uniref:Uncharacterized protein n=1 Tax=Obesumbacterium proteus ATCC 12841 TaxID=1354268 RepID=A0AA91EH64_9GAMM|nr:hypothetical protein [Obesumbacterium proteus]AMO82899.1 hypothetical protein DSM2777_18755 [Obesumbacterium proteus]OAT58197.1 hypothetical protein M993_03059 [Obesumbacterium proteus ATCC 12841]
MTAKKITQTEYEMIYIKSNDVVIVHIEPYTISILTKEQAQSYGYDISKMVEHESISINGIPKGGYEIVEYYYENSESVMYLGEDFEKLLNSID